MLILYFISVFTHILFATIWLGGSILVILLYQKEIKSSNYIDSDLRNSYSMLQTFRTLSWICYFILMVTGLYNLFVRGYNWYDLFSTEFWLGYFGETLKVKLFLFVGVLSCAIINEFLLRNLIAGRVSSKPEEMIGLYKKSLLLFRINLVLGFCILFCAIILVRGRPW